MRRVVGGVKKVTHHLVGGAAAPAARPWRIKKDGDRGRVRVTWVARFVRAPKDTSLQAGPFAWVGVWLLGLLWVVALYYLKDLYIALGL